MEKVAITGGAGFIGSNMAKRQLELGNQVVIIDNLSCGSYENLKSLGIDEPIMVGDLRDYDFAKKALAGVDSVFHFAGEVGNVTYLHGSNARELAAMQANLVIDTNVFKSCIENNVKTIIYSSSVAVYSLKAQLGKNAVFKEEDIENDVNPEGGYGWAKYIGEQQLKLIDDKHIGILRIFHAYGPNIVLSNERAQVIASLIKKVINYPNEEFVVWGDGSQKRSFFYIDDLVDAFVKLKEYVQTHPNLTLNAGSEDEISIGDLAKTIVEVSGKSIPIKFDTTKPRGTESRKSDITKIKKVLGWSQKTDLKSGLAKTYAWAQKRLSEKPGT